MQIKIYDGAESIGGTKIYLSQENSGIFLDFGLNFNTFGLYFKEFLQMRAGRGLNDPIEMGLLPKISIYRRDLIPSDLSTRDFEKIKVDAILISHAHADHFGCVGFVDFNIPIVASPMTLAIIKALSDCGHTSVGMDAFYSSKRERKRDGRVLDTINWRKSDSIGSRPLIFTEKLEENLKEFMSMHPNKKRSFNFENYDTSTIAFNVRTYPVDHSIYGARAYVVEGEETVAYTGDIRLHGENGYLTLEFAKKARDSSILIVEGTRTSRHEHSSTSERDVKENIKKDLDEADGLVIIDFSARNFERLKSIDEISRNLRELVITEKDFYTLHALKAAGLNIISSNMRVYRPLKIKREKWIEYLEENTDIEDRYINPEEIRKDEDNFILSFSLYDMPNLLDIKPKKGTYIYSSTEALDEEQEFDFITLNNWLKRFNFETKGFRINAEGKPEFDKGYHASGHASPEDLKKIIDTIDPDIIIPVHTINSMWFTENYQERVRIVRNGESIKF